MSTDNAVIEKIEEIARTFEQFKAENDRLQERIKALEVDPSREEDGKHVPATTEPLEKMEARIAELELQLKRAPAPDTKEATEEEAKTIASDPELAKQVFLGWMRYGHLPRGAKRAFAALGRSIDLDTLQKAISENPEFKALTLGDDTTGGYLAAPPTLASEIIKNVVDIDPIRQIANVQSIGTSTFEQPKRTGTHSAAWTAETGTRSETTGTTWGKTVIPTHEMSAMIDISRWNLEDSAYNLEAEISSEFSEQFAAAEGAAFVNGSAVTRPEGFLQNADISYTANGHASLLQADGLISILYDLKALYSANATWVWERATTALVRKLKDGEGNYLWVAGLATAPPTVLGRPYVEAETMPTVASDAYPVALGDFRRGYKIVDRAGMAVLRDQITQAASGNVRFWSWMRVGGQVVQAEAIRKLKIATS